MPLELLGGHIGERSETCKCYPPPQVTTELKQRLDPSTGDTTEKAESTQESATSGPGRHVWIGRILILFISLAVFLEGGARFALSHNRIRRLITGFDDSSYRLQWVGLHQQHLEWTGPFAAYHPIRGWALKPDVRDLKVYDGTVVNTNSKGLRETTEYSYARTPGKRRMLVLGDSFTFGTELPDDQTYCHYLESTLPNTEVLNLGVQGYGHDQMLLYLKEEGVKYRPDIVLLGFTYIDIYRNIESFFAYAKPEFILGSEGLKLTHVPVPRPDRVLAKEPYRLKSLDLLTILREKVRWALGLNEREAQNLTQSLLHEMVSTSRSIGAVPVFVYMPVYEEIQPFPQQGLTANSPPVAEREQYFLSICQKENLPCLSLRPRFHEEVEKGVDLNPRHHWNARAHAIAGEEIRSFLLRHNLVPDDQSNSAVTSASNAGTP